jgi:hypothetical protein
MQPPRAWLAAEGTAISIDTAKKIIAMQVKSFVYHDKEYKLPQISRANMDVHIAQIRRDSIEVPLSDVVKGEAITVVSYADAFKTLEAKANESGATLMNRFPDPEPIDEVYVKRKDTYKKDAAPKAEPKPVATSFRKIVIEAIAIVAGILLLFLLWPSILLAYYKMRANGAKSSSQKAYWVYRTATYYLHQLGFSRGLRTPMQFAREVIDPALGTSFASFMNIYLKDKYAKQPLNEREVKMVDEFLPAFFATIRQKIKWNVRTLNFLKPLRAISFFVSGNEEETA